MKKIIRRWGESLVISFDKEDQNAYNIEEGDIVDLSEMSVIKKEHEEADENISNILAKQKREDQDGKH